VPANPGTPVNILERVAPGQPINARDVVVSKVPMQEWVFAADAGGGGGLVGIKLDNRLSIREVCSPDAVAAGCGLDPDWRDPTIMGRDPTVDPATGEFDATDPSGPPFFRIPTGIVAPRKLAQPSLFEQIGTQSGRRIRDSFMPGSGAISHQVMRRMYGYRVCEANGTDVDGNGLGELGEFRDGAGCVPFREEAADRAAEFEEARAATAGKSSRPSFKSALLRKARGLALR
jgi:hypothetical protein